MVTFICMLADRTLDSVIRLHILVADVNDNASVFILAPRLIHITSPLAGGSLIADFQAINSDAGQNALITRSENGSSRQTLRAQTAHLRAHAQLLEFERRIQTEFCLLTIPQEQEQKDSCHSQSRTTAG